jgi:outer membrane protein OmpA-like peptidoglycan-associated protein
MRDVKSSAVVAGALLLGMVALGGCATKGFVRESVAVVDERVQGVDTRLATTEGTVQQQGAQLAELDRTARDALERATAAGKLAEGKFLYQQVLADDSVKFDSGKWVLTPEGEARLTELATRLKGENRNVYLEIQGHTDATGSAEYNNKLGAERAEAVRRFLAKQGVALNRIATISYGEDEPVAANNSRDGRAQNRRVVVMVLA